MPLERILPDLVVPFGTPVAFTDSFLGANGEPDNALVRRVMELSRRATRIEWTADDIKAALYQFNVSANVYYFAEGSCDNLGAVTITRKPETNPILTVTLKVGVEKFSLEGRVELNVHDGAYQFQECTDAEDEEGALKARAFVFDWKFTFIASSVWLSGSYPVQARQAWHLVTTQCCAGEDAEDLREEFSPKGD